MPKTSDDKVFAAALVSGAPTKQAMIPAQPAKTLEPERVITAQEEQIARSEEYERQRGQAVKK